MIPIFKTCQIILFALCLGIWLSIPLVVAQEGALDGKVFVGQYREKHKGPEKKDELEFLDGDFYSIVYRRKGFRKGIYTTEARENKIYFEAETINPKQGIIKWRGIVYGEVIEVNYQWIKKGWFSDKKKDYSFHGTLKK